MGAILDVALPFFAIIFAGYLCLRREVLNKASVAGLNGFVFNVALPSLLFVKISGAPVGKLFDWRLVVDVYAPSVVLFVLTFVLSLIIRGTVASGALRALSAVFGNWGYMGIPLLLQAFGPEAALVAVLAILLDMCLTMPATITILETARGGGGAKAFGQTVARVLRNPIVLGALGGFAVALLGVTLPRPVAAFFEILGAAASPCALFALGASLVGVPIGVARGEVALVTFGRMVLHPLLVWYGAFHLFPLPSPLAEAAVINAALPTAATVFVVAQRYDTFVLRSSTIVLVTHLVSVVTVTALLAYFR